MKTFTAPRTDAREAHLELIRGGTHVTIGASELDDLCRASFDGVSPRAAAEDGQVTIAYPRFSFAGMIRHPSHRAKIELSRRLPWSLALADGLGDSSLDLRGLELRRLEIGGGAANVRILLPAPSESVSVRIGGGASKVTVLRPPRSAAVLNVRGGATRLAFDGERYGAIGGETRLETPNHDSRDNRYEIEILGGASELTVAEHDGRSER
jgi:hypothetical protein